MAVDFWDPNKREIHAEVSVAAFERLADFMRDRNLGVSAGLDLLILMALPMGGKNDRPLQ
ncbi:hypothetical protein AB0G15_05905 [Streptosporangium sp. NPDC023825]|uniref:hypothetical protein n=1 Tax=Streptosporangium sp. NPDC023825 TaxID=3154909 RepID=UPI00342190FE